jgi:hypothetical protein
MVEELNNIAIAKYHFLNLYILIFSKKSVNIKIDYRKPPFNIRKSSTNYLGHLNLLLKTSNRVIAIAIIGL